MGQTVHIFVSYSHQDEDLHEQLAKHLGLLKRQGLIAPWYDRKIPAGNEWAKEIDERLKTSQIILLLISADFINSDYCYGIEMEEAMRRHKEGTARVIPIILRPVDWHEAPFAILKALPKDGKPITKWTDRDEAFLDVATEIRDVVQKYTVNGAEGTQGATGASILNKGAGIRQEEKKVRSIKALFLAANPTSTSRLAIDEEMRAIEQKVRAAEHRDALVFQSAWAVRPDDLLQLLNQHQPQIVHFSGHGSGEGLALAGENGQVRPVTTRALQALFRTLKGNIRLVFLNACYSREQAQALVETIDCVIGMKQSIHDKAAATFASSFYRAIGFGHSIQQAFEQGITSLLLEGIPDEDVPELLVKAGVDANKVVLISSQNP